MGKAQRLHNFAAPGQKYERLKELNAAKKAYEAVIGKALQQKAAERKRDVDRANRIKNLQSCKQVWMLSLTNSSDDKEKERLRSKIKEFDREIARLNRLK